jgi:uncharacterized radical SAM superfamily Fe-S cluster-containing enzyme
MDSIPPANDPVLTGEDAETESLCPVCLTRIPATRAPGDDGTVYQEKRCPVHGPFRTPIWRGHPPFHQWRRPKIPTRPPVVSTDSNRGCPFDCGLCAEHRQRSCAVLIEVTRRCNLGCPICYADAGDDGFPDPPLSEIGDWFRRAMTLAGDANIQLSGGEPTVRDDLPEIVAMGREAGFSFIQVNTNGIRLGRDADFGERLKQAGLSSVFLQFDGVEDGVYRRIRGRSLFFEKRAALDRCRRLGLGVVLVPTLIPGVNDGQVGDIIRFAARWSPAVRSVHFQPISYFGRYADEGRPRLTLPELMQALEDQTGGMIRVSDFRPPGCENARCSFHANYIVSDKGGLRAIHRPYDGTCCPKPIPSETGADKAVAYVARQWSGRGNDGGLLPMADAGPGDRGCASDSMSLDAFLDRARTHTLSVSAMAFQDAWNLDLERVRDCCIHVLSPDGRLIPFCLYNLTDARGRGLYRS